jgi:hypothetical protein
MLTLKPKELLDSFSRTLPKEFWKMLDELRFQRLAVEKWDRTYFAPRGLFIDFLRAWSSNDDAVRVMSLKTHVLGAWRATQGVYRFDQAVYEAVVAMDTPKMLPNELFLRFPEWSVYVETPELKLGDDRVFGFFATLEQDQGTSLVLLVQTEKSLMETVKIKLTPNVDLIECIKESVMLGYFFKCLEDDAIGDIFERQSTLLSPFLNLLLFVCTQASEIGTGERQPVTLEPTKTKKGLRLFPPSQPAIWDVGARIGSALRLAQKSHLGDSPGDGYGVRPHIRRAHWHGYWFGQRESERHFKLKWLPPIAVRVDSIDALPAVVREVA